MKRIIDIEQDYYEIIKYNIEQGQKYKPWEIIANSIPYEERPQGEWIVIKSPLSNETVIKCPICKEEFIGNDVEDYNFCPICGADMRGGAE